MFGGRSRLSAAALESGISSLGACAISLLMWGDQSTSVRLQVVYRKRDCYRGRRNCVVTLSGGRSAVKRASDKRSQFPARAQ